MKPMKRGARTRLAIISLLISSTAMAVESPPCSTVAQDAQNQFIGCLAGYIGAKYMGRAETDYESSMQLATKIVKEIAPICPNPTPHGSDMVFSEPGSVNSWMVAVAAQFLAVVGKGEKPLPQKW
jgi:hypothetical protein